VPQPFEVAESDLLQDLDSYVDEVFSVLESQFLTLPRGEGFIEYSVFERGYEALKRATHGFSDISAPPLIETIYQVPAAFVVLRSILGFTPPEWAYITNAQLGIDIGQGAVRSMDRAIRFRPLDPIERPSATFAARLRALVESACQLLRAGPPLGTPDVLHRLDKADTIRGHETVRELAQHGVPYPVLLYERFLGRPFAAHRDSVSELVGDVLENAVIAVLDAADVPYHKTQRAERIEGFDQAPDFLAPDSENPALVIEAKLTEDDGTARDKVTRVQHLASLSRSKVAAGGPAFQVVACIAGRGFKVRREDMKKLLIATGGKVFTLANVNKLVDYTRLAELRRIQP
jgi:hypothetical protein